MLSLQVLILLSFEGLASIAEKRSQSASCKTCTIQSGWQPFVGFLQTSAAYLETPAMFDLLSVIRVELISNAMLLEDVD